VGVKRRMWAPYSKKWGSTDPMVYGPRGSARPLSEWVFKAGA